MPVLQELSNLNVQLVVASYNCDAERLLQLAGIYSYFTVVIAYEDDQTCKLSQLRRILSHFPEVSVEDFHFFDDLQCNVDTAVALGMSATLVDYTTGIQMHMLH